MELNKTQIERATKADLQTWASQRGLTTSPEDTRSVLQDKLMRFLGMAVEEQETPKFRQPATLAPEPKDADMKSRLKPITIRVSSTESDKNPVPVTVNGRTWLLQRDVEMEVPHYVYQVLADSVEGVFDPTTGNVYEVPSYPVTIIR